MSVLLLELNEINFDQVRAYGAQGQLPVLNDLIARHGMARTSSEVNYEDLEPWIQWVTAHTGLTLAEHGVFRLGDILDHELDQIWEVLERQGVKVGAISPMNAKNRCADPAFFVPDPWTRSRISGSAMLARLYEPISQAVNDNAGARIKPRSALDLLLGMVRYARPANYAQYVLDTAAAVRGRPWRKAMVLDRLLADVFVRETAAHRPGFASLFLNAGAHIQHHYLFSSATYEGPFRNPEWYVARGIDPVLEVYALYDRIVGQIRSAFPDARLMLATGLHQNPHGAVTMYWRLRDHEAFLRAAGVPFAAVEPRMSRDFVVIGSDAEQAQAAQRRLEAIRAVDGTPLFEVDNRGDSLFVQLVWDRDLPADFEYRVDNAPMRGLHDQVDFVAIKNGEHDGIGYFVDTGLTPDHAKDFPLTQLPARVAAACGKAWPQPAARPVAGAA